MLGFNTDTVVRKSFNLGHERPYVFGAHNIFFKDEHYIVTFEMYKHVKEPYCITVSNTKFHMMYSTKDSLLYMLLRIFKKIEDILKVFFLSKKEKN